MTKVKCLVVGGGPSGLALAYGLKGDTLVLEKEATVGGLCRSIYHRGGVFDIGGHSFHTPHPKVFDLVNGLLEGGLYMQERDARIYTHGTLIPYPFQKNFDRIPNPEVVATCERGLRGVNSRALTAETFESFILQKFGQGIADHFMLPYNRKLWARDLQKISCEWTSERVAAPRGVAEWFDFAGDTRKPLQADTWVGYPKEGGYARIYESFVPLIPGLEVNSNVCYIDPKARIATTASGEKFRWRSLVSTIPLPILVRIVGGTPRVVVEAADRLVYLSLRVELLLVGRKLDTSIQRIYSADPAIPPHKIALNHNSSPYLREQPCHAIMAEVSISPDKPVDVDSIADKTIAVLCDLNILSSAEDIIWRGHQDVEYAYPVYTSERPQLVKTIKDWMRQYDIYTLGRFGDWEYINSDACVLKGLNLAAHLRDRMRGELKSRIT